MIWQDTLLATDVVWINKRSRSVPGPFPTHWIIHGIIVAHHCVYGLSNRDACMSSVARDDARIKVIHIVLHRTRFRHIFNAKHLREHLVRTIGKVLPPRPQPTVLIVKNGRRDYVRIPLVPDNLLAPLYSNCLKQSAQFSLKQLLVQKELLHLLFLVRGQKH